MSSNSTKKWISNLCALALLPAAGCASALVHGGKIVERDVSQGSAASYRVDKCVDLTNNSPAEKPGTTYHVVQRDGKTVLFERGADGTGTLMENHWSASDGEHYFVWVGMINVGYEIILPGREGGSAQRRSYIAVETSKSSDGTIRPTSQPGIRCDLVAGAT